VIKQGKINDGFVQRQGKPLSFYKEGFLAVPTTSATCVAVGETVFTALDFSQESPGRNSISANRPAGILPIVSRGAIDWFYPGHGPHFFRTSHPAL
jgi:hypothetical protein